MEPEENSGRMVAKFKFCQKMISDFWKRTPSMMNKISENGSGTTVIYFPFFWSFYKIVFSGFIDDNPDGLLSRDKMLKMYIDVLSNDKAKKFVEQIFSKYDTDNSGAIDFKVGVVHHTGSYYGTENRKIKKLKSPQTNEKVVFQESILAFCKNTLVFDPS